MRLSSLLAFVLLFALPGFARAEPPQEIRVRDLSDALIDNVGTDPHPALAGDAAFFPLSARTALALMRASERGKLPEELADAETALFLSPAAYPKDRSVPQGAFLAARLKTLARAGRPDKARELIRAVPAGMENEGLAAMRRALDALREDYAALCAKEEAPSAPEEQGGLLAAFRDEVRLFCAAFHERDNVRVGVLEGIFAEQYKDGDGPMRFAALLASGKEKEASALWRESLVQRFFGPDGGTLSAPLPDAPSLPPSLTAEYDALSKRPERAGAFFDRLYVLSVLHDVPIEETSLREWLAFFASRALPLPDGLYGALLQQAAKAGPKEDAGALLILLYQARIAGAMPAHPAPFLQGAELLRRTGFRRAAERLAEKYGTSALAIKKP
jgi:hypothetical protein